VSHLSIRGVKFQVSLNIFTPKKDGVVVLPPQGMWVAKPPPQSLWGVGWFGHPKVCVVLFIYIKYLYLYIFFIFTFIKDIFVIGWVI
jgi:hypothetical protein